MTDRRFIEDSFPIKEVGINSAKEKSIHHGHISTIHTWWARRPLAASRSTVYAALTPAPNDPDEWQRKWNFIVELSKWENSNNHTLLNTARKEILAANDGVSPLILDPFAGGGSFPLEALRLGCNTYSFDYNPVAVLVEKASIDYPLRFLNQTRESTNLSSIGNFGDIDDDEDLIDEGNEIHESGSIQTSFLNNENDEVVNALYWGIKYYGSKILNQVEGELGSVYPPNEDGSIPIGYLWARTLPCQNPNCGEVIPLLKQLWLVKKSKKKIALLPYYEDGFLNFKIVGSGYEKWPAGFDPDKGTISRAVVTCPKCGGMIDDTSTRDLFKEGKSGQSLLVVISKKNQTKGKFYRLADSRDIDIYNSACNALPFRINELRYEWGIEPVPDESLPLMSGVFNVPIYGVKTWGDLFNNRQKLVLLSFVNNLRKIQNELLADADNRELGVAILTYLAFAIDKVADYYNMYCRWRNNLETVGNLFSRQAIPMVWDYVEGNPISGSSGTFKGALQWILLVIESIMIGLKNTPGSISVQQNSATNLPISDNSLDAVFTDPPYYNSVPYADLSDFFYVWLKRSIGELHPDLFSTHLTPKEKEITEMAGWDPIRYPNKDKEFFEENLINSFQEIYRVLKIDGIAIIVYAHKSAESWETVINALMDSGLNITGAYPINTEMQSRLRATESAALASSIYIVARKVLHQPTGFYQDIRDEIKRHLDKKLNRLWQEGIGGADFFIAAIGSAIEVYGKYEQVIDYEGNIVRADRLLQDVRTIATDYAVHQILQNGFVSDISDQTRFYVLWRWNYSEAVVPFDEARKLGQSCGVDVSLLWGKNTFVRKEKEFIRLLGPQNRKLEDLEDPRDLIDVLHKALLLWEKGKKSEMIQVLSEKGYGMSEAFYRVAQAISETLPLESREKKLLDGFLAGKERVQADVEKINVQGRLFK